MSAFVYKKGEPANSAYLVRKGPVIFNINENDSFKLLGDNITFGVEEILLEKERGYSYRMFSVQAAKSSSIPKNLIVNRLNEAHVGVNILKNIAKCRYEMYQILKEKNKILGSEVENFKQHAMLFYYIVHTLEVQFKKLKFPWMEEIIDKAKLNLSFTKGQAYTKLEKTGRLHIEGEVINDSAKFFPSGSYIYMQDQLADEFYIINKGRVKIYLDESLIGEREENDVIGIMPYLLSHKKRTANMYVSEDTELDVIKYQDFPAFLNDNPDFLIDFSRMMSERIENLTLIIDSLNEEINNSDDLQKTKLNDSNLKAEIKEIYKRLKEEQSKNDQPWLADLIDHIHDEIFIKTA